MGRRAQGWQLRRRGNGIYSVRFVHEGERVERSTGERDSQRAGVVAARIYAEVVSGRRARPGQVAVCTTPIRVLFANWLADAEASLDETTAKQYKGYARAFFLPFFSALETITTDSGRDYVRARLTKVKRKTVLKELSALRGFLGWCREQGHLAEVPMIESPSRRSVGTTKFDRKVVELEPSEVEAILAQLPDRTGHGGRPKAFYVAMWETGLRTATLQQLRVPDDYARGRQTLVVRDEADKARFGRELPLSDRARAVLDEVCPDVGLIFGRHEHRAALRSAAKRAGLPDEKVTKLSNHDFRHARATYLACRSQNLVGLAYLLGHKHITTTSLYAKPRQSAAKAVLAAVGGIEGEGADDDNSKPAGGPQQPADENNGADSGAAASPTAMPPNATLDTKNKNPADISRVRVVRKRGLEPPRVLPHRNLNAQPGAVTTRDSSTPVRQQAAENGSLDTDSGAVPQNPGPVTGRPGGPGADGVGARLREALQAWEQTRDVGELRRRVLALLLELE